MKVCRDFESCGHMYGSMCELRFVRDIFLFPVSTLIPKIEYLLHDFESPTRGNSYLPLLT